jgi:PAS domain S-box-containing protein
VSTLATAVYQEGGFSNRPVRLCTLLTFVVALGATALFFRMEWHTARAVVKEDLLNETETIAVALSERMRDHRQILRSGAAMMMASEHVSREEWKIFDRRQQLRITLPGIQGFGYALKILPDQLERHIQDIRAEGYPDYRVWPEGKRPLYSSIVYLEPFAERNLRAFGYDMFSEPVRRAAMQAACDEDMAKLSGPVLLVQEDGHDVQFGTLMYAPVYRRGTSIETVAERRAALVGWVYSPYRMNDLINGTLGANQNISLKKLRVAISDQEDSDPERHLFDTHSGHGLQAENDETLVQKVEISESGRKWLITVSRTSSADISGHFTMAWLELGTGTLLSCLMTGLVYFAMNTQCLARNKAAHLTSELRQSEQRWQFAIEGSGIGVWDWDVQSGNVMFSRRWKEMLGYAENEISNSYTEWTSRVLPMDLGPTLEKLDAHLTGKTSSYNAEFRMIAKDGSLKWILDRGLVIRRDAAQRPLRMVGSHTDITFEKNHQKNLADMLERQQQLTAMKTRFISVTSHEFRTPMSAAMTASELLVKHAAKIAPQKQSELLTRITISLQRMSELLDEILTLNRIDEGQFEVRLATIDLVLLCQATIEEIKMVDQHKHAFELCGPASVPAMLDTNVIHHILTNLLSNAVRYSPEGTKIITRIETGDAQIRLTIEDQGIGIPAADLHRIFEPFERGSNIGQIKGTGLGLSIVKRMATFLDGSIEVESVEGQGSRFTLILPVQKDATPPL